MGDLVRVFAGGSEFEEVREKILQALAAPNKDYNLTMDAVLRVRGVLQKLRFPVSECFVIPTVSGPIAASAIAVERLIESGVPRDRPFNFHFQFSGVPSSGGAFSVDLIARNEGRPVSEAHNAAMVARVLFGESPVSGFRRLWQLLTGADGLARLLDVPGVTEAVTEVLENLARSRPAPPALPESVSGVQASESPGQ